MSETLHPTPWSLKWNYQQLQLVDANGEILTEFTYAISTHDPERYKREQDECDTEFVYLIRDAVNAHDALVNVCEQLLLVYDNIDWLSDDRAATHLAGLDGPLRAALKLAREGQ